MKTEVLKEEGLKIGARLIREGELVAFPTETVYGLGADAFNEQAVKNIFTAKGRPQDNPLIVHIDSVDKLDDVAYATPLAVRLFDKFSPGPLTLVLNKKPCVPDVVSAGLSTVAVRIPKHAMARELIRLSGTPIAAPSANVSGRPSPTCASDVYADMHGKIPLILDGGDCDVGIESTVLDLTGDTPTVLRPGYITIEMLLNEFEKVKTVTGKVIVAKSPGMKHKHYAPSCPMVLGTGRDELIALYDNAVNDGYKPVILTTYTDGKDLDNRRFIDMGKSEKEVSHNLFTTLRRAEKEYDYIVSERVNEVGLGGSVMNRMKKAAGVD